MLEFHFMSSESVHPGIDCQEPVVVCGHLVGKNVTTSG